MVFSVTSVTAWADSSLTLPYVNDFSGENALDGWTLSNCDSGTGIKDEAFKFKWTYSPPQYLISPELPETTGDIAVAFKYYGGSGTWTEEFSVGYSVTNNETDSFTWDTSIATSDGTVHDYFKIFPAATKYVAIRHQSTDQYYLTIDDLSISEFCSYDLWVGGTQVTSENASDVFGNGTASFDKASNTLTLSGASIADTYEFKPWYEAMIYSELPTLNIVLEGDNVLESTNSYADGIDAAGGCDVIIKGSGSLAINNPYYGTYIGDWETPGGNLTVKDGATLTVSNSSCAGIWVNHNIDFLDCTVTVNKTTTNYDGIVANQNATVTVNGATLNVSNYHSALHFGNGDDTQHAFVLEKGTVSLTSTDGYAVTVEPYIADAEQPDEKDYRCSFAVNGGTLEVNSALGGVNFPKEKITLSEKAEYKEGTSLTETGKVIIGAVATVVTKDNFFDYFTAEGVIKNDAPDALLMTGDFSTLSVPLITLNKTVDITSDNAAFNGTSFLITADDVSVDGLDITQTGEYAVKIDKANGVALTNNSITFTGDRTKGELRRALVVNGDTESPISTVTVKDNFFDISLASETVIWQELTPGSGNWVGKCPSVGIEFCNCNEMNFIGNNVDLKTTEAVGSYDTVFAVATDNPAAVNAVFNANGNAVSVEGKTYAYAFSTNTKSTVLTENTVNCKSDYYASAVDVNIGGAGFNNSVVNNKITAEAELAYGVNFTSNSSGAADLASVENDMDLKGHFCLGVRFSDIYDKKKNVTAFGNSITAEGDYLVGISVLGAKTVAAPSNTITVMGTNTGDTAFWENGFNREYGSCGVYTDSDGVITNNTVHSSDIGVLSLGGATVPNNTIVTDGEYTIDIGETNATVVSNTLNAKVRYGDDSIRHTAGEIHDNTHAHDFGSNEKVCKFCGVANPDYKEPAPEPQPTPAPVLTPEEAAMPTEEKTEELIKKTNTDKKDVAGSDYQRLMLKATPKGKTITLKWKKISGANGYIIYGAPCGKKMTRLATVTNPKTVKKTFKKLKKGKYYKYMVVAYKKAGDGSSRVISKSKSVHCTTPGGKKGNPTGLKAPKALTVKKGKKAKIKAKLLKKGKVATHIAKFRYESSNKKIATVDAKGYIKGKKKGTVKIYVYTQNGICKTIKVKVK